MGDRSTQIVFLGLLASLFIRSEGLFSPLPPNFENAPVGVETVLAGLKTPINAADTADLLALPVLSPRQVLELAAYRNEYGPICGVSALNHVRGIGPKTALKLAPFILVDTPEAAKRPLNRWNAEELEEEPGVGPVLSGRILARRQSLGGFRCYDQLLGISGVGNRLASQLWRAT